MNIFKLPVEVRIRIYDFCFPPKNSRVELIPYYASSPACRLELPLSLYLVCKLIHSELPPLRLKLRSLDILYVIRGVYIGSYWPQEYGSRGDDDPDLGHFRSVMRFAERVRLVGEGEGPKRSKRPLSCASRRLSPGPECALRVLEVQPMLWNKRLVVKTIMSCLGLLAIHPDAAPRLEVRLIRDEGEGVNEDLDNIEEWLQWYQGLQGEDVSQRFSASGNPSKA